ncbi:MAG: hypothetical protein QOF70_4430 [Acetobacteraceae bacterium]|nr:hypothetical protein [Acetobacteraceae bacterium]
MAEVYPKTIPSGFAERSRLRHFRRVWGGIQWVWVMSRER